MSTVSCRKGLGLRTSSLNRMPKFAVGLVLLGTLNGWAKSAPEVGVLTCDVSMGIDQSIICDFRRPGEPVEAYSGIIEKFDPTLDADEDGHLAWVVVAKSTQLEPGGLSGDYARVGTGLLVGRQSNALTLRPLASDSSEGVNFAARVIKVTLVASN